MATSATIIGTIARGRINALTTIAPITAVAPISSTAIASRANPAASTVATSKISNPRDRSGTIAAIATVTSPTSAVGRSTIAPIATSTTIQIRQCGDIAGGAIATHTPITTHYLPCSRIISPIRPRRTGYQHASAQSAIATTTPHSIAPLTAMTGVQFGVGICRPVLLGNDGQRTAHAAAAIGIALATVADSYTAFIDNALRVEQ